MSRRRERRKSWREIVTADVELLPLMNLFIVLIPMMLLSAVFMEIRVIEMSLPSQANATPPQPDFELAVHVRPRAYVVEVGGAAPRTIERPAQRAAGDAPGEAEAELSRALGEIAAAHPEHHEIRIVADATTRYEEIITVMDVARGAGFSQTALAGGPAEAL
jgi:biopolymer transport protein ExbD